MVAAKDRKKIVSDVKICLTEEYVGLLEYCTYFASGATITSFFGISVMSTSVVSTRAAMDAAFSMALMVTLRRHRSVGED